MAINIEAKLRKRLRYLFLLEPLEAVVAVYPIVRNEVKYLVEFVFYYKGTGELAHKAVRADLFLYNEEKKWIRGHKGKFLWSREVTKIQLGEDKYIDFPIEDAEFEQLLPSITELLFAEYEARCKPITVSELFVSTKGTLSWNGDAKESVSETNPGVLRKEDYKFYKEFKKLSEEDKDQVRQKVTAMKEKHGQ